jgi:hypothetical protein
MIQKEEGTKKDYMISYLIRISLWFLIDHKVRLEKIMKSVYKFIRHNLFLRFRNHDCF